MHDVRPPQCVFAHAHKNERAGLSLQLENSPAARAKRKTKEAGLYFAMSGGNEAEYLVEELADAKLPPKAEVLAILESLTLSFLGSLARGEDPSLHLVNYEHEERDLQSQLSFSCFRTKFIEGPWQNRIHAFLVYIISDKSQW